MEYEFSPQTLDEWREYFYIKLIGSKNNLIPDLAKSINHKKKQLFTDEAYYLKKIVLDKKRT